LVFKAIGKGDQKAFPTERGNKIKARGGDKLKVKIAAIARGWKE